MQTFAPCDKKWGWCADRMLGPDDPFFPEPISCPLPPRLPFPGLLRPTLWSRPRNLSKIYRDFWGSNKKSALKPLDLEIRRGEIFGLLGPNGSGKTTTMKLLLGLIFPTSGDAFVFGKPATDVSKNERIGYLP